MVKVFVVLLAIFVLLTLILDIKDEAEDVDLKKKMNQEAEDFKRRKEWEKRQK